MSKIYKAKTKPHIELIPMIDVMLFLLAFFVLISINVIPAFRLDVNSPSAAHAQNNIQGKPVVLTIEKDGVIHVDEQVVSLGALTALLEQRKVDLGRQIVIRGDEALPYQKFVDVLDSLHAQNYANLTLATRKAGQ